MTPHGMQLSVDFGTSNTVAALGQPDGRVRPLLFDGSPTLPSAVFLDPAGGLLVGRDAVHTARTAPDRFEPNPKRRVDEQAVLLGGVEVPVVDLIAAVLLRVATEARRVAGGPVAGVTLTHPASWAHTRRQILVHAAEQAGIPPTTLVPEPVAAADTFLAVSGSTVPIGSSVVVYDLGAGTFDASVLRRSANGFDVVSAEGLSQAGGLDIDAAIVGYLGAMNAGHDTGAWQRLLNPTTSEERRANRMLWEDVRNAKELLSRASQTQVFVPLVGVDVPLGRDQFELLARPILDATITATRAALNSARVRSADIAGIFLVGGGSRIPLVATLLHRAFERAPTVTEQPELVVAEGGLRAAGRPVRAVVHPTAPPEPPTHQTSHQISPHQPPAYRPQEPPRPTQPPPHRSPPQPESGHPVSGPPVSAQPVSGHPIPSQPVSAQPVSGQPMPSQPVSRLPIPPQPVSGRPGFIEPVSGPEGHEPVPPAVPAMPVHAMPVHAVPVHAVPVPGYGPTPAPPTGRAGRTRLAAIAATVVVLVAIGTVVAVTLLRNGDDRRVDVDRTFYNEDGRTIMLTNLEVDAGKLRVNLLYYNGNSQPWSLVCPPADRDLRSSFLTVNGKAVHPVETWCSASSPGGDAFALNSDESGGSYAVFDPAPAKGTSFSLHWYEFPKVDGLTL